MYCDNNISDYKINNANRIVWVAFYTVEYLPLGSEQKILVSKYILVFCCAFMLLQPIRPCGD